MAQQITVSAPLRKVQWTNLWNRTRAYDRDGQGTVKHLTAAEGLEGKTLCGKKYYADKGYPSRFGWCKKCVSIAREAGHEKGFTAELGWVPSEGGEL